jgi:hypothetical protein
VIVEKRFYFLGNKIHKEIQEVRELGIQELRDSGIQGLRD